MGIPMKSLLSSVALLLVAFVPVALAAEDAIHVPSALLTTVERVDVPAAEDGILTSLSVREGDLVEPGQLLGLSDVRTAALQLDQVAQDLQLARDAAKNDTRVRLARKEHELAQVELDRAYKVNESFTNSVSAKEIDRLKLSVERTRLEIEFAQFEQSQNAQKAKRIEADLRLAQHQLELRKILAPIAGMIVHVEKQKGEWVNRGELVARIVRVNRLRAEGFVDAQHAILGLVGRPVRIEVPLTGQTPVTVQGHIVFVSPEVQPVNSQVRFWAEFDNKPLRLRPGLTASLTIEPPSDTEHQSAQLHPRHDRPR
jgi:macrolide-specific efflux system membrane fusion protein